MLLRFWHPGSPEVRGEGLTPRCAVTWRWGCNWPCDVRGDRRCLRFLLPGYLAGMQTPNIFDGAPMIICLLLYRYSLVHSSIICWQVSCGLLGDSKTPFWFLLFSTVLNVFWIYSHLGARMGRDGSGYRYGFPRKGFPPFYVIYICSKFPILRATSPRIEGFMPGWPVPYWRWGSDGIAIFYYRYWQYHVAERQ